MLRTRTKLYTDQGARAKKRLALVEASITALADEDLLDLADIFRETPETPIASSALAEIQRRGLSL